MNLSRGKPWNNFEIEAIVSAYKEMLWLQVLHHDFSKTDFNQNLQRKTGRSKASIEFKLRNISAVMSILQLPEVKGYFPAKNFQKALFDCIFDWDRSGVFKPIIDRLLIRPQRPIESGIFYVNPPNTALEPSQKVKNVNQLTIKGIHFPSRGDWRYRLGKAGEEYVYHAEVDRLALAGRNDLSNRVRWVTETDDEQSGFDIRSFDTNGKERLLGIKTTIGAMYNPFFLTANEFAVSEARKEAYRLIRLFEFGSKPKAFKLAPPLTEHLTLSPSVYNATM